MSIQAVLDPDTNIYMCGADKNRVWGISPNSSGIKFNVYPDENSVESKTFYIGTKGKEWSVRDRAEITFFVNEKCKSKSGRITLKKIMSATKRLSCGTRCIRVGDKVVVMKKERTAVLLSADEFATEFASTEDIFGEQPSIRTISYENDPPNVKEELLKSVFQIFERSGRERIRSLALHKELIKMRHPLFMTFNDGSPIAFKQMSRRLSYYGLKPKMLWFTDSLQRGLLKTDLLGVYTPPAVEPWQERLYEVRVDEIVPVVDSHTPWYKRLAKAIFG